MVTSTPFVGCSCKLPFKDLAAQLKLILIVIRQEQPTLYPEISSYNLAVDDKGRPMREIYSDFSEGIESHLDSMKKTSKGLNDEERIAHRTATNICQHMYDALKFQTTPIPTDEINVSAPSATPGVEAEQAWDATKLAWAKARVAQYPLRGIMDSTFAWKVKIPWSNHQLPQTRTAILDALECFSTQAVKQSDDQQVKDKRSLYIPVLVVENKTQPRPHHQSDDLRSMKNQARNQRLLYCVSALRMLSEMQITNFPVIGLATVGQYGTLCAGWWSKDYIVSGSICPTCCCADTGSLSKVRRIIQHRAR